MDNLTIYKGGVKWFYYLELDNQSLRRDNLLSDVLNETHKKIYLLPTRYHPNKTSLTHHWEFTDKIWECHFSIFQLLPTEDTKVCKITLEEFLNLIPDEDSLPSESKTIDYYNNLKIKKEQLLLIEKWENLRKSYKAISSYKRVEDPQNWKPCKVCGLIPLIWEFNNGSSTACGCGENEYRHHSIHAESIMSYVSRNSGSALGYNHSELKDNWNTWVETGEIVFEKKKQLIEGIW